MVSVWAADITPLLIEETPSNPSTVHPVNLYPLRVGSDLTTTFSPSLCFSVNDDPSEKLPPFKL